LTKADEVDASAQVIDEFGAVFDNPNLIVACVVGDGEAATGPLATASAVRFRDLRRPC
jgi:phosphoketolase